MEYNHFSYTLTESAEADLDGILDYIIHVLENPEAASAFADSFEEQLFEICRAPSSGRLVQNPYVKQRDIRRFLVKNYTVYYIIDFENAQIVILRIIYTKRDQTAILAKL